MLGTKLGVYEITESLGAGGMGAVYRARDTKLGRDVAIKVVLDAFLADRDRLARFEREARALAALNHPNIATLHGMEEAEGRHFLVMELVAGEDLSSAIARGLRVSDAIAIASQIAEALEAAHEKGIVHRDLKPANVKITPDEKVKVLDFGLATMGRDDASGSSATNVANSPTITAMGTQAGMILGTASYMSPEQARGSSGDHRSDVFSFGVVLFEMLTGRQPFQGETVSDVLASVLARDPDLAALPKDLSPRLTELLARCLDKHPKRRWQAMGDIRHELEVIANNPMAPAPIVAAAAAPQVPLWRRALAPIGGLVIGIAATAAVLVSSRPAPAPPESIAFEITPPSAAPLMSLSPDGRQVVYGTLPANGETRQLWLRSLDALEARGIPGTDGAMVRRNQWIGTVAWSPTSDSLAYIGYDYGLHRIDFSTGQSRALVKMLPGLVAMPGAWNRDGVILFGQRSGTDPRIAGIWRVSDAGGTPEAVTELKGTDLFHRAAGFLPDGKRFLYSVTLAVGGGAYDIRIGSIDRKPSEQDTTTLLTADGPAVYAASSDRAATRSGYLLFVRNGSLMAQAFDADRGVLTGDRPIQLASGMSPFISVSDNGRLLARPLGGADTVPQSAIMQLDRTGKILATIGPRANYSGVDVLPDGRHIAVSRSETSDFGHLYIVDLARPVFTRLNPGEPLDFAAAVAPDNQVAFTYSPDGVSKDIYMRASNGVGELRLLTSNDYVKHPNDWTHDGRFLIYDEHAPTRAQDLLMVSRDGGKPITLMATEYDETFAMVSPDGKWLAYRTTESQKPEVYIRDFYPGRTPVFGSEKIQVSVDGGDKPRWSRSGNELFFFNGSDLMAASIKPEGTTLKVGIPTKLFTARYASYMPYDVLNDGTFIVNTLGESNAPGAPTPMRVVLNWESLIKK